MKYKSVKSKIYSLMVLFCWTKKKFSLVFIFILFLICKIEIANGQQFKQNNSFSAHDFFIIDKISQTRDVNVTSGIIIDLKFELKLKMQQIGKW